MSALQSLPFIGFNVGVSAADIRTLALAKNPGLDWPEWMMDGATAWTTRAKRKTPRVGLWRPEQEVWQHEPWEGIVEVWLKVAYGSIFANFLMHGIICPQKEIFRTLEEAEAACRALNGCAV